MNQITPSPPVDAADPPITEQDIEAYKMFELELPDRTLLSGPSSRINDLATLFRVCVDMLRAFRVLLSSCSSIAMKNNGMDEL